MKVNDTVFGQIEFNIIWSKPYNIEIFNREFNVSLIIQTFDNDDITDNQRITFSEFEKNKKTIIKNVELAVIDYYKNNFSIESSQVQDVGLLIELIAIKIMYSQDGDDQNIGIIFDAEFDPELGIGVLISNGEIEDVDVQDIVLG